ncbi:MAG: hypothetical protein B1H09_05530 [Gemmatimonadaceae bacterium 4484_173]|nr:MAG: hypothetical protein B1H09_05530 [Gemmatimonadaceae bacterium 4484_173]RKZ03686.1 MAG: hypothetical protein DRQ21_05030 [Candidatus Fermentibacteria bacterium]
MKIVAVLLLTLSVIVVAEDVNRHAVTISAGIPGLLLPELTYEYSLDESSKLGISAGTFLMWPEYRKLHKNGSFP